MATIAVGKRVATWFSARADGMSTILAVAPYQGLYKDMFTHTLRVSAPRTTRGWMEMAVNASHLRTQD